MNSSANIQNSSRIDAISSFSSIIINTAAILKEMTKYQSATIQKKMM